MSWVSLSLLLALAFVGPGTCAMVNRTIDDQHGDQVTGKLPVYTPPNGWIQGSTCKGCGINISSGVDPGKLFNGTWHDTTVHPGDSPHTISLNFTGNAVYVFNMIANTIPFVTTQTHLIFSIDGERVGTYDHAPANTPAFDYDVPVYTNSSLPYGEHNLQILADGSQLSLVLFDYVVYTTNAGNSSVPSAAAQPRVSSKTVPTPSNRTSISSSTSPKSAGRTSIRSSISSHPSTSTFVLPTAIPFPETNTSTPSPTPLQHGQSKHLTIVASLTAALSFLCGMIALAIFRARKSIMLCLCRARGWGGGKPGSSRVYPAAGSSSSSTRSSLDVNFSSSRSVLTRPRSPGSPSSISRLPSTPPHAFLRNPPPVHQYRNSPAIHSAVPIRHRSMPPTHSVDVPRSAVSSSRTGTDHSSGSISELRRELRSLREKLRELQSPRKHRLRLADGHEAAGPGRAPSKSPEGGVPVTLETLQEDV